MAGVADEEHFRRRKVEEKEEEEDKSWRALARMRRLGGGELPGRGSRNRAGRGCGERLLLPLESGYDEDEACTPCWMLEPTAISMASMAAA